MTAFHRTLIHPLSVFVVVGAARFAALQLRDRFYGEMELRVESHAGAGFVRSRFEGAIAASDPVRGAAWLADADPDDAALASEREVLQRALREAYKPELFKPLNDSVSLVDFRVVPLAPGRDRVALVFHVNRQMEREFRLYVQGLGSDTDLAAIPNGQAFKFLNWPFEPKVPTTRWPPGAFHTETIDIDFDKAPVTLQCGLFEQFADGTFRAEGPPVQLGRFDFTAAQANIEPPPVAQGELVFAFDHGAARPTSLPVTIRTPLTVIPIGNAPFTGPRLTSVTLAGIGNGTDVAIDTITVSNGKRSAQWTKSEGAQPRIDDLQRKLAIQDRAFLLAQLIVSVFAGWCAAEASRFFDRQRPGTFAGVAHRVFVRDRLWVFWISMLVVVSSWCLALWADWPGVLFVDAARELWILHRPSISHWHGYVFELTFLAPLLVHDSPATLTFVQILFFGVLIGAICRYAAATGAAGLIAALAVLGLALAPSVVVYTITPFKDTTYAILTVLWCFLFFRFMRRSAEHGSAALGFSGTAYLTAALFLISTIRHNGVILLALIPLMMAVFRMVRPWSAARLLICTLALYIGGHELVGNRLLHANSPQHLNRNMYKLALVISPLGALLNDRWYYTDDPEGDRAIIARVVDPETLRAKYDPSSSMAAWEAVSAGWNPIRDEDIDALVRLAERRTFDNMPIFLADRARIFSELVVRPPAPVGQFWTKHYLKSGWYWCDPNVLFDRYRPATPHRSPNTASDVAIGLTRYRGLLAWGTLMWTSAFAIAGLAGCFLLYKWLPASAAASALVLVQLPFLIVALPTPEFRYLYFVYIMQFFLPVFLACEICSRLGRARATPAAPVQSLENAAPAPASSSDPVHA